MRLKGTYLPNNLEDENEVLIVKVLNFSVVEILPSLLDKSKTQTIRKAWEVEVKGNPIVLRQPNRHFLPMKLVDKPPRFKVGDKVQILWNQKSKYEWFCKWCGGELIPDEEDLMSCKKCLNAVDRDVLNNYEMYHKRGQTIPKAIIFNKHLGTVEITEVFKIEMFKYKEGFTIVKDGKSHWWINGVWDDYLQEIAKLDGFFGAGDMFKTIDKMYDLSSPKTFFVYRWKWLK